MAILKPFQLLEINVISAQDLEPVSKKMRTYATAWVHSNRKLSTRVDVEGDTNPTWNDKFVFRVDEEFLRLDTSAVMIEIYSSHWLRDSLVGTVRVLVGNLVPPPIRSYHHHHHHLGMRFVALQVRRPSGRPQGILNLGVALLDSSMRSMPLYTQLSASAVGFRELMGEEDSHLQHHHQNHITTTQPPNLKPILRRSQSERSELVTIDKVSSIANSSMVAVPLDKGTHGGDYSKGKSKKGKASSVISGAELQERPKLKGPKGKASSILSYSIVSSKDPAENGVKNEKPTEKIQIKSSDPPATKVVDDKSITKSTGMLIEPEQGEKTKPAAIGQPVSKHNGYEFGAPKRMTSGKFVFGVPQKANSLWSDSEVGPSPSEVAAAMATNKYPLDEDRSSVLDGWSLDESIEGLRSKLERWRTELPPLYDRAMSSSSFRSSSQHVRRHSDGGSGLFSCFGNIYGYECQCVCGKPPGKKRP